MEFFNTKCIVDLLLKHKVSIIVIIIIAGMLSIIFSSSYFITPLYKATVILYPTTTYSVSKAIMNTNELIYVDPLEIGEEAQTDQMIQILSSNIIRSKIIERFNLFEHYGLSSAVKFRNHKMNKQLDSKIRIRRTEYNAVKISVLDSDPQYAADIANEMAALFDTTLYEFQRDITAKALEIVENEYNTIKDNISKLQDSLHSLAKNGIYDYDLQIESLNNQLAAEIAKGSKNGVNNIKKEINDIVPYAGIVNRIKKEIQEQEDALAIIKTKYDDARINATQSIPHKFVIASATPDDKQAFPCRIVIVLITMLSTFIVLLFSLIFIERIYRTK